MPPRHPLWARGLAVAAELPRDLNPLSADRLPWPGAERSRGFSRSLRFLAGCGVVALAVLGGAQGATALPGAAVAGAVVFGLVYAGSLALCLYRPLAGWWLALVGQAVLSEFARGHAGGSVWAETSTVAYLCVLGVAGLRVRPRVLVAMWVLTLVAGVVLAYRMPPGDQLSDVEEMSVLSAVVLIAVGALRGRSVAARQVAAQRALTTVEQQRRAVLEERSRIARELHDVLAHHMSVIAIQAEAAPYRVPDPHERLTESFATIKSHAQDALTELRRVLGVLRAEHDDTGSAPQPTLSRVPDLVAGARDAGLRVSMVVSGDAVVLPPGLELSAYRIIQEGLNNVMKHAPGADVRVELDYRPSRLRLEVVNGPARARAGRYAANGQGHGVVGMRERVAMLKGDLTVGATPAGGYAMEAVLPLGGVEH
ncbi:hypothetical protein B1813_03295 [Saccharomonospora piscinae]|uniref:histidine kinase n=1 Tax=Saccharomonospora piscinae TaxID=687388 RepID=A0A1V9ADC0_SACPI|nr:histidine kinase [Saccharomonospora piscinae]OQO95090.1 hypothetical protein B1813_03295 [Saccharomonospora piscinae]